MKASQARAMCSSSYRGWYENDARCKLREEWRKGLAWAEPIQAQIRQQAPEYDHTVKTTLTEDQARVLQEPEFGFEVLFGEYAGISETGETLNLCVVSW